jgi:hypothetical protein
LSKFSNGFSIMITTYCVNSYEKNLRSSWLPLLQFWTKVRQYIVCPLVSIKFCLSLWYFVYL